MTAFSSHISGPACQRGMTLIEILVAIVVLSIGLLGLAGLQLKGLQVSQGSTYRWQAAMLAEDIADRIRADQSDAGSYALALATNPPTITGVPGADAAVSEWWARVQALPGATAAITAVAGSPNAITIQIGWVDTRAQRGAGDKSTSTNNTGAYSLTTELSD
jgi:type IV pilus assembly protein PilV